MKRLALILGLFIAEIVLPIPGLRSTSAFAGPPAS